jgi:hypothetical protein
MPPRCYIRQPRSDKLIARRATDHRHRGYRVSGLQRRATG